MTLVRSKRRDEVLQNVQEERKLLSLLKFLVPVTILALSIFGTYFINSTTSKVSEEIKMYRENISHMEQEEEVLNMQISKLLLGRDVVN